MNDFLDRFTTHHKLPAGYLRARKSSAIAEPGFRSARDLLDEPATLPVPSQVPEQLVVPDTIPLEYDDPKAQAAFEAVYRNRKHLLRVRDPGPGRMSAAETVRWLREKGERATTANR